MLINTLLLGLFGVQHSIMARPGFKAWWTRFVPNPIERSTYVLFTCVVMGLLFWHWRPMTTVLWQIDNPPARYLLMGLFFAGWALVLYTSFLIDHFELFGVGQVLLHLRGKEQANPQFVTPPLYRLVRHPLMLGFLIAFWFTPKMTYGHLLFAIVITAYVLVAIQLEERDLGALLGEDYRRYRQRTPMILPWPRKRAVNPSAVGAA
jgi:protein-S-isoprenylcysteine O-methyltransferase Ste14